MFRERIKNAIREALKNAELPSVDFAVEVPDDVRYGDYATNAALVLAKEVKKNPLGIAEQLKAGVGNDDWNIAVAPPGFLNFSLGERALGGVLKEVLAKKEKFGAGSRKKETIVIEYSSPNIAKPLGVHHLRSTIIGQALVNILRFVGHRTISLSFPGDWGTQFGLLIAGYKRWGDPKKIRAHPIDEMLSLYVRFSQAAKEDPELLAEGRREFRKLEQRDRENRKLWRWFLDESLRDFERVYKLLGVKIEHTIGESFYEPELTSLVEDALKRGVAKKGEDGSVIIPIPGSSTPEIIQKSDGATIYTTREVAAIRHRLKKWNAEKVLYVAANQQTFHLEQVFHSAELLGFARYEQLGHVKFGMMLGPGGKKFATREGKLIPLEAVLKESIERARNVVEESNQKLPAREKQKIAKAVGIGAVKYADLHQHRQRDIIFDWDRMLSLKGESAPYLQYTHARLKSILRKGPQPISRRLNLHEINLQGKELLVLRQLVHFPEVVEDAAAYYEPNRIARYLYELAERANAFYETVPVLAAEGDTKKLRLAIVQATAYVLKSGLVLFGIEAPGRM